MRACVDVLLTREGNFECDQRGNTRRIHTGKYNDDILLTIFFLSFFSFILRPIYFSNIIYFKVLIHEGTIGLYNDWGEKKNYTLKLPFRLLHHYIEFVQIELNQY